MTISIFLITGVEDEVKTSATPVKIHQNEVGSIQFIMSPFSNSGNLEGDQDTLLKQKLNSGSKTAKLSSKKKKFCLTGQNLGT